MTLIRSVSIVAFAALITACSTPASRIENKQAVFDSYPPEVQNRIRAGDVSVGFYPEQVTMALGKPDRIYSRQTEAGTSEIWAYRESTPALSLGLGGFGFGGNSGVGGGVGVATGGNDDEKVRVVFANGQVVSVERTIK
jgi:hypothetical protein